MTIQLYKNKAEPRMIDKSKLLIEKGDEISGDFRDAVDIQSPSIRVNGDAIANDCNYLYIKELDRYYFITSIIAERNSISIINCKLDVLYTYMTALLNCYGLINRAENGEEENNNDENKSYNRYVYDNKFVRESPNAIVHLPFDLSNTGTLDVHTVLMTTFGADPIEEP